MSGQEERMPEFGKYIVFEGGEHVGKTTQAAILARAIGAHLVGEPGGTMVGQRIRSILLNPGLSKLPMTEVLLHAAQRAELAEKVIKPRLLGGDDVVSDRSWVSSAAYQGVQGIEPAVIGQVNQLALGSLMHADLLLLLDADPSDVQGRSGAPADYYERQDIGFHRAVREQFLVLGRKLGAVVIDATASIEEVSGQVRQVVSDRLNV